MSDAPFQALGLDHVVLRVANLESSLDFYCRILGLKLDRARDDLGLYHILAGRCMIDLVPVDGQLGARGGPAPGTEGNNMDHFCIRIDPFDEAGIAAYLQKEGIEVGDSGVRYGAEGDGPSIYIGDPDGNTVELKGPPS